MSQADGVVVWDWYNIARPDTFKLTPIGDIHLGNESAEKYEGLLQERINEIMAEDNHYVALLGDPCEFINRKDKRFDPASLASWISVKDLTDIAKTQRDRFLDLIRPLAIEKKILVVVKGNHEEAIEDWTERAIYNEIVTAIKQWGNLEEDRRIGIGVCGWLILRFRASEKGKRASGRAVIKISLHHGFVGGRLAGAKALNLQRWLWNHECDIAMMGHSHDTKVMAEAVETVNPRTFKIENKVRYGCITGNWMGQAKYAKRKGYFPCPVGYVELKLRPRAAEQRNRIRATAIAIA